MQPVATLHAISDETETSDSCSYLLKMETVRQRTSWAIGQMLSSKRISS
jgi:hypothetical protein